VTTRDVSAAEALAIAGLANVEPQAVVFWSGAGISNDAPTCAPLGGGLTVRALGYAFEPCCLERIRDYYAALRVKREYPRLETVLDVVHRIVGADALADVLSDMRRPHPNDVHAFFAHHLDAGGRQITANFDDCIERSRAVPTTDELIHFHGSFAVDPCGASLGATLGNIQGGFPPALAEQLRTTLTAPAVEAIVFVGYSGYDAFDVAPFLRSLAAECELEGKNVLWVRFRRSGDDIVTVRDRSPDERVEAAFQRLNKAGASCFDVEGEPRAVLVAFAARWGWPADLLPAPPPCTSTWTQTLTTTDEQRRRASLELYAMMGLHSAVRRLFAVRAPATPSELELAAHTTAADGRYRDASTLWRAAVPGNAPLDQARREEHVASCWWREGRLLRAYLHLRSELKRAESSGVTGEPLWHLVSTTAHVFGHMRRRPLLRFFPTRRRRRFFASRLPEEEAGVSYGPHLDAMLAAARSRLGVGHEHSEEKSLMFDEAEALHGMLNFRHASLRRRGSQRNRAQWPPPEEYIDQQNDFRAIGLNADVVRVPLLPGASHVFDPYDVWRGLGRADFTPWHRLMLFGEYTLRYVRRR
jgi:hypothetical protein